MHFHFQTCLLNSILQSCMLLLQKWMDVELSNVKDRVLFYIHLMGNFWVLCHNYYACYMSQSQIDVRRITQICILSVEKYTFSIRNIGPPLYKMLILYSCIWTVFFKQLHECHKFLQFTYSLLQCQKGVKPMVAHTVTPFWY